MLTKKIYNFRQAYQQNESDSRVSNASSFSESGQFQKDQNQQLQHQQLNEQQQQHQHQNEQQAQQCNYRIEEDAKKTDTVLTTPTTASNTLTAASSSDPLRPISSSSTTASAVNSNFLPTVEEERELVVENSGFYFRHQFSKSLTIL
jgi:hypothetical protein